MPEKREMKRLEELAKKKRRLFVLHQRLATDATLPSMGPLTQKRRSQVHRESDNNPKINKNIQVSTKESTSIGNIIEKHEAGGSSRVKRSSILSSHTNTVKHFTPIKIKQGRDTSQSAVLEHDSKSSEGSLNQTVLTVPMATRSRDNSPHLRGTINAGHANSEHFETTEISGAAVDELISVVTKQTSQDEHASEIDNINDAHPFMSLKPVPIQKIVVNNTVNIIQPNKRKKRRKRGIIKSVKVKRLKQPVKIVDSVTQKRIGRPKGSKNKTWTQIAASKLKLRSAKRNDSNQVKQSISKSIRKRTLSDEYDLIDERELKKKIRSTTEDMTPNESEVDKKEDHDQSWTDSEEMGVHGSNISYSEIPNPDELDECFENVFTADQTGDQTDVISDMPEGKETSKSETVLPEIKSKRVVRKTKSKTTDTALDALLTDKRRGKQVVPTVTEFLVKPNGETITLSKEKIDHITNEVTQVESKKPDQRLCETVYPEISPRKIQHRIPKSHVTTVTEIVVKPSGEATPLRVFTSTNEDLCISPELTVICSEKDTQCVVQVKPKKKKKKKDVMTYKSKRFSKKKMKQKKFKLVLPLDLKAASNSAVPEENFDIPVLSPTGVSDNQLVNEDLPSPGLNMPVLIKEQLLEPFYKLHEENNARPRGRPRIHPKKIPSGRSRGRPRKYFNTLETPDSVMATKLTNEKEFNELCLPQVQEDSTQVNDETVVESICNLPKDNSNFNTQSYELDCIHEIIQSLLDKVCNDLGPKPELDDDIVQKTAFNRAIKPKIKFKKRFRSMYKKRKQNRSKTKTLSALTAATDNKWKLDHSLKSGSPEGSTKLVFKRRRKVYKSMSERENSLFLAGVEELMKSEEKNEHVRQFMFRNKISRSPIQSLARKQKLEEEEYDKYQKQTRKHKVHCKVKDSNSDQISTATTGSVQNMLNLCSPCSVYLTDFVKSLKLNTTKDEDGDDSFSSELEEGLGKDSISGVAEPNDSTNSDQYNINKECDIDSTENSHEFPCKAVDIDPVTNNKHTTDHISDSSKRSIDETSLTESHMIYEKQNPSSAESLNSASFVVGGNKSIVSQTHESDNLAAGQSSDFSRTNTTTQHESSSRTKYFCKACEFSSQDKNTMKTHIYIHLSDVTFQCGYCQAKFLHHIAAQTHQNTFHIGTPINIVKSRSINENDYYNTVVESSNTPLIISLVVQGNVALDSSSLHTPTTRFVCTHCQYSTNVKEDIRQHVIDLHADKSLFVCTLCDKSIYHSNDEISSHCKVTHPTRLDSSRKLPDFYDCEQLAEGSERGRVDSRANIFERMTNLFSPSPPHTVDSENTNHFKRAREYLNIQEAWKNKTSAEADSTTAEDVSNEEFSNAAVNDNAIEVDDAEMCQSTSPESYVVESGSSCDVDKNESDTQAFEKSVNSPAVNQIQITKIPDVEKSELHEDVAGETQSIPPVVHQLDKLTEIAEGDKNETHVTCAHVDEISPDSQAVDQPNKFAVTSEIDHSETKESYVNAHEMSPEIDHSETKESYVNAHEMSPGSLALDPSIKFTETFEGDTSSDQFSPLQSSKLNSKKHQVEDKVREISQSDNPLIDVDDNSNLKSSESVEDLTDSEAVIIALDDDLDDETTREPNRELVADNHPEDINAKHPEDINAKHPVEEKTDVKKNETCELDLKEKSGEDILSSSKTSPGNLKEKVLSVSNLSYTLLKQLSENESMDCESNQTHNLAKDPQGGREDTQLKIVSVVSLHDTSATTLPKIKHNKAILPKAPVDVEDLVIRNERLTCTYKCKECSVHAPFLSVMIDHLKLMHKSICVFSCPYCKVSEGKKPDFKDNDDLRQHIAKFHPTHFAKKDISLSDSAKEIVQVIAIPSHIEPQRGNKTNGNERDIYMCRKCNSHLPTLAFMYSHIESEHSDVFLYVCPECKTFKNKSETVVYDHIERIHQNCNSSPDLPLAMEDNLLTRVYSISKNGLYIDRSPNQVDKVVPKSSNSHAVASPSASEKITCLPSVTSSKSNISRDTVLKTLTCVNTISTKTPTARKSIRQTDDAKEALAIKNSMTSNVPDAHPIVGSQLFTKSSTPATSTIIQSQPNKSVLPTSVHSKHVASLMSKPAVSFTGQRHSSKTVAQQLRERHALTQAATEMANRQVAMILGKESNPLSVKSKKFSMTDKLHRLGKQNAIAATNVSQKPVLNVPTMDKVRNLARPKSTELSEANPVDLSVSQDMSRYPGILRPPCSSKDSPILSQDRSTPKQSLLFQRGVSPNLALTPPQLKPQDDTDELPPDAFKIFNLKPSKSPAPTKISPSATPPASTTISAYPTQMPNTPSAYQFTPLQIAQLQRGVPSVPGLTFAQGFPGFVLVQPPTVNIQQLNSVNASEASGALRASTPLATFLCHYCPQPRPMPQNEIIAHIQQAHKGCPIMFNPSSH